MGLLAQHQLFQYIDTHLAQYQEQIRALQTTLESLPEVDHRMQAEILVSHLQPWHVQTKLLDMARHIVYTEYASGASRALLRYIPASSPGYLIQVLYDILALDSCQDIYGSKPVTMKWLLDCSGGTAVTTLTPDQLAPLQADGCLWHAPETDITDQPTLALGVKGILRVELTVQTGQLAPPLMHDAVLPNALWRLVWAISTLKNAQEDILIEGFYDTIISASSEAASMLKTLPTQSQEFARRWGIAQSLLGLNSTPFHYAHRLTPTCTLTNITHRPARHSSLPVQASAQLLFHLVPGQEPEDIFQKLQRHLQIQGFADVQVRIQHAYSPVTLDRHHAFAQAVQEAYSYAYSSEPALLPLSAGGYPVEILQKMLAMPVVTELSPFPSGTDTHDNAIRIKQAAVLMILLSSVR